MHTLTHGTQIQATPNDKEFANPAQISNELTALYCSKHPYLSSLFGISFKIKVLKTGHPEIQGIISGPVAEMEKVTSKIKSLMKAENTPQSRLYRSDWEIEHKTKTKTYNKSDIPINSSYTQITIKNTEAVNIFLKAINENVQEDKEAWARFVALSTMQSKLTKDPNAELVVAKL